MFLPTTKTIPTIFLCLLGITLLSGCGTPGIPLPPSLELPKPVTDLHAMRKGNKVYLTWTPPNQTTDRLTVKHPGVTRICRSLTSAIAPERKEECENVVGTVPPQPVSGAPAHNPNAAPMTKPVEKYTDEIPTAGVDSLGSFTYAVEVTNDRGRSAGLSNLAQVPAVPTLSPPAGFAAQVRADGIFISWTPIPPRVAPAGLRYVYRIYRREENSKDRIAVELPLDTTPNSFLDHNFEWEKRYTYRVTVVTLIHREAAPEAQEGDDTDELLIFAHDIFPPGAPSGLQAVFSGENQQSFIDLIWNPNGESDLAGYNIFRHENGAPAAKINSDLVKLPAFRDLNVPQGKKYYYSVSAVDVRGNESFRSQEANETAH